MKKFFEKTTSYLIVFSMLLNYFAPLSVLAEENNLNESSGGIGGNLGNESGVVLDDNTVLVCINFATSHLALCVATLILFF